MTRYVPTATAGILGHRRFGYYTAGAAAAAFTPLSLSPALWSDPSDAATVTISGSSGAYIGASGLVLLGTGTDYAESPNLALHQITGSIDIIAKVTATDWTPAANMSIVSKLTAGANGWGLTLIATTGVLRLEIPGVVDLNSTVGTGLTDGATKWVRATRDTSTGDANFYLSDDGSSWTQLGATVSGVTTAGVASTVALRVGYRGAAGSPFGGTIHRVIVKSGIGGTTVYDADFESATPYASVFTESSYGVPVYVVSTTAASATASYGYIGGGGLVLPGAGANYASSPDLAASRPTGDFTLYADVTMIDWTPGVQQYIALHGNEGTSAGCNWLLYVHTDGTLRLFRPTGSTARTYTSSVATGLTDGTRKKIKVTWDQDNGSTQSEAKFYLSDDGSSWTQLGTAVTNASTGAGNAATAGLRFGSSVTGSLTFGGTIHSTKLYSDLTDTTKVLDVDFEAAAVYTPSFTESSSNAATITVVATNSPANAAGACVSQINDKSGNARHLTQGTLANMPKYWNGLNGLNCLVFDGTNDKLATSAGVQLVNATTGLYTAYAVATPFSVAAGTRSIVDQDDETGNRMPQMLRISATAAESVRIAGGAVTDAAGVTLAANAPHVFSSIHRAAQVEVYVDGTSNGASASTGSNGTDADQLGVGAHLPFGGSAYWSGTIGEIAVMSDDIGSTSMTSMSEYLKSKWGTP